jgi:hypothetical protein
MAKAKNTNKIIKKRKFKPTKYDIALLSIGFIVIPWLAGSYLNSNSFIAYDPMMLIIIMIFAPMAAWFVFIPLIIGLIMLIQSQGKKIIPLAALIFSFVYGVVIFFLVATAEDEEFA